MNELQKAEAHTILPVERLGDTLLVTPHGDLGGFSHHAFLTEYQRVDSLLDDATLKNLIIDLGQSRYFGSEMIGALVAMRQKVSPRGRVALADVSRDTRAGLDIIRVDSLFEFFNTRRQAVSALARLTVRQRVQRHRRSIMWLIGLFVMAGTAWGVYASKVNYRIFGSRTARVHEELARHWIKYESQNKRWTPEEARTYRSELHDHLRPIEQSLKQRRLISVKEDYWLQQAVLQFQSLLHEESEEHREEFLQSMKYARKLIVARTGLDVSILQPANPDVDTDATDVAEAADRERLKTKQSHPHPVLHQTGEETADDTADEAPASQADQAGDTDAA